MFLQLNPLWDGPIKQLLADADAWLCKRRTGTIRLHQGGSFTTAITGHSGQYLAVLIGNNGTRTLKLFLNKGQCRLYFLRSRSSFNIFWTENVLSLWSLVLLVCCGVMEQQAEGHKLIFKAGDVIGVKLDSLVSVMERQML